MINRKDFETTLYRQLHDTAEAVGINIISDEKCCQLMAWLLEIGGYTEESTHNRKLREDIFTAQKRLKISGANVVKFSAIPMLKDFVFQLRDFINEKTEKPQWLTELEDYYKIKPYGVKL